MKSKIIFMGTPEISVPSLKSLIDEGFDIPLVISQPDKPKGRGNKLQMPPVKEFAIANNIQVVQPSKIKNNQELFDMIRDIAPDFFAVVAYGKILPLDLLNIPKLAPINVHFSLLPLYRGAAPVNHAILNGDSITGVTTMLMDQGMDTGDILLVEKVSIDKKDAIEIASELAVLGGNLLVKTIKDFTNIKPIKQSTEHTVAPMIKKDDGLIDWSKSADYIERSIRAFKPWPSAYTFLDGKVLKIYNADVLENKSSFKPGTVSNVTKDYFCIATGVGELRVKELQLEGKRKMNTKDFLSGFKLESGKQLGE